MKIDYFTVMIDLKPWVHLTNKNENENHHSQQVKS